MKKMRYEVVFDNKTFRNKLIDIAENLKTKYNNVYPRNLGYYTASNNCFSFDCWNLVKTLIWGWKPEKIEGYYCYEPDKYGLGDWDGKKILNCCSEISSDFTYIQVGEFLLTQDGNHAGIYIGDYKYANSMFNVVEATPIWFGGVQFSWVDNLGVRKRNKNDSASWSKWKYHGLLPWVEYKYKEKDKEEKKKERERKIELIHENYCSQYDKLATEIIEGKWGNGAQRIKALNSCGYDYKYAQSLVDARLK